MTLGLRPCWGQGPGDVRYTAVSADAEGFGRALPGILAGRPRRRVRESCGYLSRNAQRVDLRLDCGFTIDGELEPPRPNRILSLQADRRVAFVRG